MMTVTGAGQVVLEDHAQHTGCDPTPYLVERKNRKYMGLQDELAVVAAGLALSNAGLKAPLGERAGVFLSVGYIPFSAEDTRPVLDASLDAQGGFSMESFSSDGWLRAHPLLPFRCLPNMPAFHVSCNFGIEGCYLVTYPGVGQTYLALEEATSALESGRADVVLWGGVADQTNFLVAHHYARMQPPQPAGSLRNAAGVMVLEREDHARARGAQVLATLESSHIDYQHFDPRVCFPAPEESALPASPHAGLELGAAAFPVWLAGVVAGGQARSGVAHHAVKTRDGLSCRSQWRIP